MKRPSIIFVAALLFCIPGVIPSPAVAQGFGQPLTIQGLDHFTANSAASKGVGGVTVGMQNDASLMFVDPAALQSIQNLQVAVGGLQQNSTAHQDQHYSPLKYYSNFSLLMEGLTGSIGTPVYADTTKRYNAGDTVQRPYDNIGPNWSRKKTENPQVEAFAAIPFSIGGMKITAGVGTIEYADLSWFFQNNNVLSPSILSVKQSTITLPATDDSSVAIPVKWYQSSQSREGSIRGYGAAFSVALSEKLAVGVSGMILDGHSDDSEARVERGRLTIYRDYFRADSIYYRVTSTGTSDYTGAEFTLSGRYKGRYLEFGFSVKPPSTITRKFNSTIHTDSTGISRGTTRNGQDKFLLPWRETIGLSIALRENLTLGAGLDIRSYGSAKYTAADGTESYPWLSANVYHLGAEFRPIPLLAIRAGVREQGEVYQPVGNPLEGQPVSTTVYSFGVGIRLEEARLNLAYEYADMKYADTWEDAVSFNGEIRRGVVADLSYDIPW